MIEQGFTALMVSAEPLVALREQRFNFLKLDDVLPSQTWYTTGSNPDALLEGDGYQKLRVQVDHWAHDALTALQLREATRRFLSTLSMVELADGTVLQQCEYIGPLDFFDNDADAFRCASEWYLHFTFPA